MSNRLLTPDEASRMLLEIINKHTADLNDEDKKAVVAAIAESLMNLPMKIN